MVNKGGWLRVVEASLAVLLIIGVILTIPVAYEESDKSKLESGLQFALESIAENESLREAVLSYNVVDSADSLNNRPLIIKLNNSLHNSLEEFKPFIDFKICLANESCVLSVNSLGESYSLERIITTTTNSTSFNPKKIKVIASEI
jgi:hypothetical protein